MQERPVTLEQEMLNQGEARQPWQHPTLQRLHVSLDTAKGAGSFSDGIVDTSKSG